MREEFKGWFWFSQIWFGRTQRANREKLEMLIGEQTGDLFVLPEMFTTGFSMKPSTLSETEERTYICSLDEGYGKRKKSCVCRELNY